MLLEGHKGSDVDPDLLYADPYPYNLMNADPVPGQYNHQIDFDLSVKSREKRIISKSVPKLEISYFFRFRLEKYNFLRKKSP